MDKESTELARSKKKTVYFTSASLQASRLYVQVLTTTADSIPFIKLERKRAELDIVLLSPWSNHSVARSMWITCKSPDSKLQRTQKLYVLQAFQ